ncbi:uncharacterized protein LOC114358075 [Ostrinia furnacalis]|uniref:uncharacterized protein LOC114358075 n=1 Tax=Ostrinia furnacalis TaxID=93504 RepID=UPI00103DB5AE|nr:uncharacterized protein LOC114358075 [Ostrinia furnacalis]
MRLFWELKCQEGTKKQRNVYNLSEIYLLASALKQAEQEQARPYFDNNPIPFSGDFMRFVKDMGRVVYHRKDEKKPSEVLKRNLRPLRISTTVRNRLDPTGRDVNNLNTQKAALRDVLMMKLVSYYEDKYKLSNPKTTVTPPTNEFVIAGAKRRHYEPIRYFEDTTTQVTDKDGHVAEVVVI